MELLAGTLFILKKNLKDFRFFSLLYGTPAPSAEPQHPEAWPASTYGHLRGLSPKIVLANKVLFARIVPANQIFLYSLQIRQILLICPIL